MAVTFDAVGPSSAGASAAGATSLTWSHTNNGNAIVAGCSAGAGNDAGMATTATYAGAAMTAGAIVHTGVASTVGFVRVFTLLSPATGTNNVVVTLTGGTADLTGGSVSCLGAGSFATQYSAQGNTATTATATSAGSSSDGLIVAFVADGNGTTSATAPSTSRFIKNLNGNSGAGNNAGATSPSTGSNVTTAWTISSDQWAVIGVEVLAGAAGDELARFRQVPPGHGGPPNRGPSGWAAWAGTDDQPVGGPPADTRAPTFPSQYGGYY